MKSSTGWFKKFKLTFSSEFCPVCSTLLTIPESGPIVCRICTYKCSLEDLGSNTTVTRIKKKSDVGFEGLTSVQTAAKVSDGSVVCGRCGHDELYFKVAQLRSADEGQTVFYECVKCSFTWSQNS